MALSTTAGCAQQPLRGALGIEEYDVTATVEIYPGSGAMALRGPLDVLIPMEDGVDAPEVFLTMGNQEQALSCAPDALGVVLSCPAFDEVPEDRSFIVQADYGDEVVTAELSGRAPGQGRAWFAPAGFELLSLGGNDAAAGLLAGQMGGDPVVAVLSVAFEQLALRMGEARELDDGVLIEAPGLTLVVPVDDRQSFEGPSVDAWLPLRAGGEDRPLPLIGLVVQGEAQGAGFELSLEAVVPGEDLAHVAALEGISETLLRAALDLDVDLDGDGRPDAASIRMRLDGEEALLVDWVR